MPTFSFSESTIRFTYPTATPRGHQVKLQETYKDNTSRVHIFSLDSREIYFELTRYVNITAQESYEQLKTEVEERILDCTVSAPTLTRLNAHKGLMFSFQWPERERKVILIERGDTTFRILYDPDSPLNEQILATLTF